MELGLSLGDSNSNSNSYKELDPPLQLDLLPFSPVPRNYKSNHHLSLPWLLPNHFDYDGSVGKRLGMKRLLVMGSAVDADADVDVDVEEEEQGGAGMSSSPNNSGGSSFINRIGSGTGGRRKREHDLQYHEIEVYNHDHDHKASSSRLAVMSDDDDNNNNNNGELTRKKLRLSKDQSLFLEESFKEHNTLNPKQKLALAKQLNLRPRQVEVWFQNRRARTKLKQTEVDCEYLKRCCETLTEENRRLQKELQELRALKTSQPFFMQLPATTLTMCPSCERTSTSTSSTTGNPRLLPFQSNKAAS